VWDYLEGGADEESTLTANRAAFQQWTFQPRTLIDVEHIDLSTNICGSTAPFPAVLAPTGYTRMFHPDGELAVAAAADAAGLPYAVSTVGTASITDVANVMTLAPWLQLYLCRDRGLSWELLARAWDAGVRTLEFSTDTAVSGHRIRDRKRGFAIPPSLGIREIGEIGLRPRYWTNMVTSAPLTFANLQSAEGQSIQEITSQFESRLSWSTIAEIKEHWPGVLLLKGPVSPADAVTAANLGINGFHLTNHGGRQLDRCIPAIELVHPIRQALPSTTIIVDGGIRHGMDIAVAIALGADAASFGRPYLYGLAAGGQSGVGLILRLLREEYQRTLQLLGCQSTSYLRTNGSEFLCRLNAES